MSQTRSSGLLKIPSLDGLRALSVGAVLVGHVVDTRGVPTFMQMQSLAHAGYLGVRTFFVISGFLITSLLLRESEIRGRISLRDFYLRRTIRIWPAFYAYVATIVVLSSLKVVALEPHDVLYAATFTMNYQQDRAWALNHIWSLSVEEQFYLLWPWALALYSRSSAGRIAMFVICVVPAIRAIMWFQFGASDTAMTREFQAVADSLACGALLAICSDSLMSRPGYRRFIGSPLAPAIGLVLVALASAWFVVSRPIFYVLMQSLANFGLLMILHHVTIARTSSLYRFLNLRLMVFLGTLSYSLYLWQELFLDPFSGAWFARFPQNLVLTFGAALLSYYLVERPFLGLRTRFRRA